MTDRTAGLPRVKDTAMVLITGAKTGKTDFHPDENSRPIELLNFNQGEQHI
jgi:hypothetical protein